MLNVFNYLHTHQLQEEEALVPVLDDEPMEQHDSH